MIKLDAIASHTVDGALQTAGTMTQVTGVAFVTVQNDYAQAVNIRQGFVSGARKRRESLVAARWRRAEHGRVPECLR
jgi:hypothetical protein